MRTLVRELMSHAGQKVSVQGWLHKKRLLGGLNFIVLRDRSGLVQAIIKDKGEIEKLRALQIGTIMTIEGVVATDERAPGGVELHEVSLNIQVPVVDEPPIEIDKPISHEPEHLDTLFEYRALNLRNVQVSRQAQDLRKSSSARTVNIFARNNLDRCCRF